MACSGGNAQDKSKMNGRISRLPVAMVSVGLVGKAVTRQLEKDQDKGKLVRGRYQCMSGGDEVGRRQDTGQTQGQRTEGSKSKGRQRRQHRKGRDRTIKAGRDCKGRDTWIKMGITYCEQDRQAGPSGDG